MSAGKKSREPEMLAFPADGFIALKTPVEMVPRDLPPNADAFLMRFRTADGFKAFLVEAMEAASMVWPEIAQDWLD